MEPLRSLMVFICGVNHQNPSAYEKLQRIWQRCLVGSTKPRIQFLDTIIPMKVSEDEGNLQGSGLSATQTWAPLLERILHNGLSATGSVLLAAAEVRPRHALLKSIQELAGKGVNGWWFSVKQPAYYLHNVLVKDQYLVKNFEMDRVFSVDHEKGMFFNHIAGRHFINTQDAPRILQNDNALCFVNMKRFSRENPIPYEFGDTDYLLFENECQK